MSTFWPTWTSASSASGTSARHSTRLRRSMRSISVPACAIWPMLTLREVMTPLSGAVTRVKRGRSSAESRSARAVDTRPARRCIAAQLVEVGGREGAGGGHRLAAPQGGLRVCQDCSGLRNAGAADRDLRLQHVARQPHQQLALVHRIADIDEHRGHAVAAHLGRDDDFLPGIDGPGCDQTPRQRHELRRRRRDGEASARRPRRRSRRRGRRRHQQGGGQQAGNVRRNPWRHGVRDANYQEADNISGS